jgi:Stringent starvation protein B
MTSNRPYLLRALYEWIIDNGMTPQIMANTTVRGTDVPGAYIQDDRIVLNIHPSAVKGLELGNDVVSFRARFGGRSVNITVPMNAILAIFARENGKGLIFSETAEPGVQDAPAGKQSSPHLTIIK